MVDIDMRDASRADVSGTCARLLVASYALMDHGRNEEAAALFADDATWVRGGVPCIGRHSILEALRKRDPEQVTRHIVTSIVVTPSASYEAAATAVFIPLRGSMKHDGERQLKQPVMVGDLFARFRRSEEGWQIRHLEPVQVFKL
jgi:hypothetical protein